MLSSGCEHDGNPLSYITNFLNTIAVPVFTENEVSTVTPTLENSGAGRNSISAFMM